MTNHLSCPCCDSTDLSSVLSLRGIPGLTNAFWPTEESARSAPRGDVHLLACGRCGLVHNGAFDETRASYSPAYDNSIHYSPVFQDYIDELAHRLVKRYGLYGQDIVEIGCGSGDFLVKLCELGSNRGTGYDPSYDPSRLAAPSRPGIDIVTAPYPTEGVAARLVACRHVLEHLANPRDLVSAVRASFEGRTDVAVYFEVPDATYMLEQLAIWDVIHEHCSYFAAPTIRALFEGAGFAPVDMGRSLGDQYLWIEARPAPMEPAAAGVPDAAALAYMGPLLDRFQRCFTDTVSAWQERVEAVGHDKVAIWGAGAKGVMFLNLVDPLGEIRRVVDINPHKLGRHVPLTGQCIAGPDSLSIDPPEQVIVMNPLFRDEIERSIKEQGLEIEVVGLNATIGDAAPSATIEVPLANALRDPSRVAPG